ncbi:hypothetical protein M9458_052043 [Cirrhinus mrigala]|uniref:Uncharacterized protein n=1 Tax=Cirrhinus mrigala TaxID=683832 RepID=A0ABD0MRV8_CIRMR
MLKELEDCYRHLTSPFEDLEDYQAEEPENKSEGTATSADSILEALDEMEERANRTREKIKATLDS